MIWSWLCGLLMRFRGRGKVFAFWFGGLMSVKMLAV